MADILAAADHAGEASIKNNNKKAPFNSGRSPKHDTSTIDRPSSQHDDQKSGDLFKTGKKNGTKAKD